MSYSIVVLVIGVSAHAVQTDYVLVAVNKPHGGHCGDPQQKGDPARIRGSPRRPGIDLYAPKGSRAATLKYCERGLGSQGLAAGCWLLAAGCWLLAAGCWLLAAPNFV
jgi:hypothetical protein